MVNMVIVPTTVWGGERDGKVGGGGAGGSPSTGQHSVSGA